MLRNIGAPEIIIIAVLLILILGWKRLPDAARSLGRSMRVFKSEVNEMKNDGKSTASSDTVPGETVRDKDAPGAAGTTGTTPGTTGTSAMREDNSPRSDNSTGL
ncbi:MAG: Sec-independent protein translocase subunit TatA [Pedococcus sp.]